LVSTNLVAAVGDRKREGKIQPDDCVDLCKRSKRTRLLFICFLLLHKSTQRTCYRSAIWGLFNTNRNNKRTNTFTIHSI